MVEKIEIANENKKDDDELEMLLGEIPHVTASLITHHHQFSHVNDNDVYESYKPIVSQTMNYGMMYGMYHDTPSSSFKQNSCILPSSASSSPQSNASFSSFFSKGLDDPTFKPHMLYRSYSSTLPNSCFGKKIDDNLGNYGVIQSKSSSNPAFKSEISPFFVLQQQNLETLYSQSNFNKNLLNFRFPVSCQRGIPALDLAASKNFHVTRRNGTQEAKNSLINQQGHENVNHVRNGSFKGQNKKFNQSQFAGACENGRMSNGNRSCSRPIKFNSLADVKGYIYMFAKEQNGCRYIQSVFDEDNQGHVEMVFNETIGHVNELMINPFGNYLMQRLLEVCNEEQRICILMEVTREPRELVHISLNPHGTRAVQKLIETLKTRKQIKMVISALEPGFLALIKDLNGNHVIQRCLQCFSNEDNKFIFEAAAKFCVDIATHQHGCCVLQRCINHSSGKHQERLILEISSNGLLLAQDAFGNYVVQSILELQMPSALSMLLTQFEGNYVHLATQKFSSHVVEKCLSVLDDRARSTIIRELLSASHFEQLLQDPHANYVVQTALCVAEGSLYNLLVKAIESHKAISRNSPYSKRIFSHKLLKK
ncbi:putative pumilio homolog 8, chloroplastic [Rutidosis leptorrhynchoides]|uniref:putative pumilio homolog 8, chloroplastic n=1 Tax=Rutidosis leptorrhynchoides TaxID=125765 RepID=UPI003A99B3A9